MSIISGTFAYKAERISIKYFDTSAVLKVPVYEKVYQGANKPATWNNFVIEIWFREDKLTKAPEVHETALANNTVAITGILESQKWQGNDGEVTTWVIKPFDYWKLDFFKKVYPNGESNGSSVPTQNIAVAPVAAKAEELEEIPF